MNAAKAQHNLNTLELQINHLDWSDIFVILLNRGVAIEILTRLESLWYKTKTINGHIYAIGKILLYIIIDFIQQNPYLSIGAALGFIVNIFLQTIPVLGSFLGSLSFLIATLYGYRSDNNSQENLLITFYKTTHKFLKLLQQIFSALYQYFI